MPKVGTEKYSCGTAEGIVEVEIIISFAKGRGFSATLPQHITKHMPTLGNIKGDSYEKVADQARQNCDLFYSSTIEQKKVILYYYRRNGMRNFRGSKSRPDTLPDYVPSYQDDLITGGQMAYCVRWMVTVGQKKYICTEKISVPSELVNATKFHWSDNGGYNFSGWMDWEAIDHTDRLEAWFKQAVDTFDGLMSSLQNFFGRDSATLLENLMAANFKDMLPSDTQQ